MSTSSTTQSVLGLILARGGSKSIHKKSIAPCAGRPLMEYTIEAAKRSTGITRLAISTDDVEIAALAKGHGVEVPFMEPADLADDGSPRDLIVFRHAIAWLEENEGYVPDIVVHLRPTTPLKKVDDIDRAITLLLENEEAESVRSICEPIHTPFKMYRRDGRFLEPILKLEYPDVFARYPEPYNMPRQALPQVWRHSGYVDVVRTSVIKKGSMSGSKILPLEIEKWRDVDIDSKRDLLYAEMIIRELEAEDKKPWD